MKQLPDISKLDLHDHCLFCLKYCENWNSSKRTPGQDQLLQVLFSNKDLGSGAVFKNLFWKVLSGAEPRSSNGTAEGEEVRVDATPAICSNCLKEVVEIRGLYTELERIQMLFLEQIGNLQEVILECNRQAQEWLNDTTQLTLEIDAKEKPSKESLAILCEFQETVIANYPTEVKVPYVLMEKVPTRKAQAVKSEPPWMSITNEVPVKRKRGRPPKGTIKIESVVSCSGQGGASLQILTLPPRCRGRPPNTDRILNEKEELAAAPTQDQDDVYDDLIGKCDILAYSPITDANLEPEDVDEYVPSPEQPTRRKRRGRPPKSCRSKLSKKNRPAIKKRITSELKKSDASSLKERDEKIEKKRGRPRFKDEIKVRKKARHCIFPCAKCGRVFFQRVVFEQHQLSHDTLKDGETSSETDNVEESKVCQICSQSILESDYNSHMLSHELLINPGPGEEKKLHSCFHKDCSQKFLLEENLKIHADVDHNEPNPGCMEVIRKCDLCNVCYDTSNDLLKHFLKAHKDSKKGLLNCPICGHAFTVQDNLTAHMYCHAATNQQVCNKCPAKTRQNFTSRSEYLQHVKNEHGCNISARCSICNEDFDDIYWYKIHLQSIHKCKDIMVCSYCGKTCYNPTAFMRHYTKTHTKVQRPGLACEYCNETFANENKLLHHRVMIHGAPKLACQFCPMEYSSVSSYQAHVKTHTKEAEFRCDICNKYFSQKINLEQHKACHSDARPYTCETCGAGCKTYWQFRSHRLTHNKQHTCDVCGRKFARGHNLRVHMKMHTGETIPCQYCGYEFHSEKSLKQHVKVYHIGDGSNVKPLYPPQKRRNPRSTWKDDDGNTVYAKNIPIRVKGPMKYDDAIDAAIERQEIPRIEEA